ncbi:MAG TPA: DUF167 domain-containing protein [Candidatus Limnocylindria bacterium]|nr:DUF167 domain-containing protein [Candidatus Limnocylindria bacterium]
MRVRLQVRVQPGARRNRLEGRGGDGVLRIKVTAPPEDGRANRAVETLLAKALGVKSGQVAVVRGTSSRSKWVEFQGLEAGELEARLRAALGGEGSDGQ